MDYELIPIFFDLLAKACGFWAVMTSVVIVYLALLRLARWRWGTSQRGDDEE